jgi:hypothetical protein
MNHWKAGIKVRDWDRPWTKHGIHLEVSQSAFHLTRILLKHSRIPIEEVPSSMQGIGDTAAKREGPDAPAQWTDIVQWNALFTDRLCHEIGDARPAADVSRVVRGNERKAECPHVFVSGSSISGANDARGPCQATAGRQSGVPRVVGNNSPDYVRYSGQWLAPS